MLIERIEAYEVELPFPAPFTWSGGTIDSYTTTIVRLRCSDGADGWGETCPFGSHYLNGYHGGVLSGLRELTPALIGLPATQTDLVNFEMDRALNGHEFVKTAIDIACWDVLGKTTSRPVCEALGGRFPGATRCVAGIPSAGHESMMAQVEALRLKGVEVFSLKLTGHPVDNAELLKLAATGRKFGEDYYADANRGMSSANALRMLRMVPDVDFYFEQLCRSYKENLLVRRQVHHPMIIDELIVTTDDILRAIADRAADALNLKVSRVGGLTKARRIRDICVAAGMELSIQDTGGCEIVGAALAHLVQSIPPQNRLSVWNSNDLKCVELFGNDVIETPGRIEAGTAEGLGLTPDESAIGKPVAVFE